MSPPAPPTVRPSFGSRLPGIEGLRAAAAGSILVMHTWRYAAPGSGRVDLGPRLERVMPNLAYGVVLFFTLSGFLLYRPFAASIVRGAALPEAGRYLRNRALRILPAYWVILLVCAVGLGSVLYRDAAHDLVNGRLVDPGLLARTAAFLQNFDPNTLLTGIGPAWTLTVEVVFYLALPLLGLLALRLARGRTGRGARRWAALAPAGLLLVVGLAGRAVAAFLVPPRPPHFDGWRADWHSVIERSFWTQADLFAFGMVLAVVHIESEDGSLRLPRWWRRAAIGTFIAICTCLLFFGDNELGYSPYNTLAAAACALLLALVALPPEGVASRPSLVRFLEWPPFIAAGVVSYGVFLWHEPLIRWLHANGLTLPGRAGFVANLAIAAAVTAAAATLTYLVIEAPALRMKRRTDRRPAHDRP